MKYEYKLIYSDVYSSDDKTITLDVLNKLGEDRWELADVREFKDFSDDISYTLKYEYIFKREKKAFG